jgi:hypothetical protein
VGVGYWNAACCGTGACCELLQEARQRVGMMASVQRVLAPAKQVEMESTVDCALHSENSAAGT